MASASTILSLPDQATATLAKKHYINAEYGLLSWLLTQNHKRIAILYLISISFFFLLGGNFTGLIRLELRTPQPDLVASDTYVQQVLHDARHQQDLFVPCDVGSSDTRELPHFNGGTPGGWYVDAGRPGVGWCIYGLNGIYC